MVSIKNKKKLNKNVVGKITINKIQSKNHILGTIETKKISLPCFDDKMYILDNNYDGLALGY